MLRRLYRLGNTLNANEPIVWRSILDSLGYWVNEMHIDGSRFDLASILTRYQHAGRWRRHRFFGISNPTPSSPMSS